MSRKNSKQPTPEDLFPEDRYDLRILRSFRRIVRSIELHSKKLEATFHITGPQLVCLFTIDQAGRITAAELSRRVYLSPSTIVGILDRLEDKGLINRARSKDDRRRIHISPSKKGKQLIEKAPSPLQDQLASSLRRLPELEQVAIAMALERVVVLMEAEEIDAAPVLETGPIQPAEAVQKASSRSREQS